MSAWLNNVRFNPTLGGLTDWVFSSIVAGYQTPVGLAVNGRSYVTYAIDASNNWELADGNYNSGTTTFARTNIRASSAGGAKVNFASVPQVAIVAAKEDWISIEEANSFTTTQQAQARSNINACIAPTLITNSLVADVAISNSGFSDGPSIAQGTTGTWEVSGTVTFLDTIGNGRMNVRLWDGTTIIASTQTHFVSAGLAYTASLSGYLASPAGNLRISCKSNAAGATSTFKFNVTGDSKDCTISARRTI